LHINKNNEQDANKAAEKISEEDRIGNQILDIHEVCPERTQNRMLEEILIECVLEMIKDPLLDYRFSKDIGPKSICLISHRKEKLGLEYFYLAIAFVEGERTPFYIASSRVKKATERMRSKKIEEILDGSDNKRK
jgi:hypothetical protein